MSTEERRSLSRVRLPQALRGSIGMTRVFAVDVSLRGVRVAHQESIGRTGDKCMVAIDWEGHRMQLHCVIRHTRIERPATSQGAKALHHSGLEIIEASDVSTETLRLLIQSQIERALDEQKANARGIPAIAANSFQTGKGDRFVRHELAGGKWRTIPTIEPRQPPTGFTIAAELDPDEVRMLREAYEQGDPAARALIRQMAGLSISKAEGIPTRRYEP